MQAQESVGIAGNNLVVCPALKVHLLPIGRKGLEQGSLSALPDSDNRDARKILEKRLKEAFAGSFNTMLFKMLGLKMQGRDV